MRSLRVPSQGTAPALTMLEPEIQKDLSCALVYLRHAKGLCGDEHECWRDDIAEAIKTCEHIERMCGMTEKERKDELEARIADMKKANATKA